MQQNFGEYKLAFASTMHEVINEVLTTNRSSARFMVVMDENINNLYGKEFLSEFHTQHSPSTQTIETFVIAPGESNKTMSNIATLHDRLFTSKFNRSDVLIGFGGGLITDFTGFAASIYKRGMRYVSIPTTVLGMSDAAIGSKTGVNNSFGKNMVGSFYDPLLIIVCEGFLRTLDDRNISNGMAEVIKIAACLDAHLFALLESHCVATLRANPSILREVMRRSMELKISIVSEDKFEFGKRKILNYGHTIGHGIEFASHGNLLHGEAVSIGIVLANSLAISSNEVAHLPWMYRIEKLLKQYDLPTQVPKSITSDQILKYMASDKKIASTDAKATFPFVMLKSIGDVHFETIPTSVERVRKALSPFVLVDQEIFTPSSTDHLIKVTLPGSKSISNRALILCALSHEKTTLHNILFAEDTEVMMRALTTLRACSIDRNLPLLSDSPTHENNNNNNQNSLTITGNGGEFKFTGEVSIEVANSGTTARFLCGILQLLKPNQSVILTCCERMKSRPIRDLLSALENSLQFEFIEKQDHLPFRVTRKVQQQQETFIDGFNNIRVNATLSSQFLTGLLLAAPFSAIPTRITLEQPANQPITSESFIDMTIEMMKSFNVVTEKRVENGMNTFTVSNSNPYSRINNSYTIEPDAATASYDIAWALLNERRVIISGSSLDSSLQGDITFINHLQALGYTIESHSEGILVRGDLKRKQHELNRQQQLRVFDFNQCTDTFITFAIILAACDDNDDSDTTTNTTSNSNNQNQSNNPVSYRITCIANQRVKECDRIAAVCENLQKFNVKCIAHEDGIEVFPNRKNLLQNPITNNSILIRCFSDHRIAMAFTHFAIFLNSHAIKPYRVILDEGSCVQKTFPEFYTHIKSSYAVRCTKELYSSQTNQELSNNRNNSNNVKVIEDLCVFIIGMRCSGKSMFSAHLAKKHNMKLICLDERIHKTYAEHLETPLNACINAHGWADFRARELKALEELIEQSEDHCLSNAIIDCGGGIVTTQRAFEILKAQKLVVWVRRDISEIVSELNAKHGNLPAYVNSAEQDYEIRRGLYATASTHVFSLPVYNQANLNSTYEKNEFYRKLDKMAKKFLGNIVDAQKQHAKKITRQVSAYCSDTFFVCLSFADLANMTVADLKHIERNYTALEVRADAYFANMDETGIRSEERFGQVLRRVRFVCERLRLIFTLRSLSEGGAFDDADHKKRELIYSMAIKESIFDLYDVELKDSARILGALFENRSNSHEENHGINSTNTNKSLSKIILSRHFMDVNLQNEYVDQSVEDMARIAGEGDIVKLVLCSDSNRREVERIRRRMLELRPNSIVIQLGESGKLSRVENACMTPVYDARFGKPTGLGQLEKNEIMSLRKSLSVNVADRKCYLFGTDILRSPSPLMHNTAFQALGFNDGYTYELAQVKGIDEIEKFVRSSGFRGASVTMPFKQDVKKFVDFVVSPAQEIALPGENAVINTLLKVNGKIFGFNTDWYGIIVPLKKKISMNIKQQQHIQLSLQNSGKSQEKYALVIGAGATTQTMVYCLSLLGHKTILLNRTYEKIARLIGFQNVVCGFSESSELVKYLETNSIELSIVASTIPGSCSIDLPDSLFASSPTIFDASYVPYETPLIKLAQKNGCTAIVHGLEMLLHQGYLQNEIFTGQRVDQSLVKSAVRREYFKRYPSK